MKKIFLSIAVSTAFFVPSFSLAEQVLNQQAVFNIESSYDLDRRSQLTATLIKISAQTYWYVDNNWWLNLTVEEREKIMSSLNILTEEFEINAYPVLTMTFGEIWSPGIDKDFRLTILVHPMKKGAGGYSDTADEYPKLQSPDSNEREMIYLSSFAINSPLAKAFLAHEFTHLITFNQKERMLGVFEDTWLNEARAEYSSTLLGYDKEYEGSNIQQRVKDFLDNPFDSLTEWRETAADYGVVNLFTQYLVEHYGLNILTESLKTRKVGIASINNILAKAGFQTDFSKIFVDWATATLLNDCSLSEKYCYFNPVLKNFKVTPLMNYLPFSGESTLSISNTTKDWAGNWYKFVGGGGKLTLKFQSDQKTNFTVFYVIEDAQGKPSLQNLKLNQNYEGIIEVSDFGSENISLTLIPIVQNKISDFAKIEPIRSFLLSASTMKSAQNLEVPVESAVKKIPELEPAKEALIAELKAKILAIQLEIVRLLQQLIQLLQTRVLTG